MEFVMQTGLPYREKYLAMYGWAFGDNSNTHCCKIIRYQHEWLVEIDARHGKMLQDLFDAGYTLRVGDDEDERGFAKLSFRLEGSDHKAFADYPEHQDDPEFSEYRLRAKLLSFIEWLHIQLSEGKLKNIRQLQLI